MASLAEDFAYYLVNPINPFFVEGEQMYTFYGLQGLLQELAQGGFLTHPDVVALSNPRDATSIWQLLRNQTYHSVTFREYSGVNACQSCERLYAAVKE
jgi:hypothetical protein